MLYSVRVAGVSPSLLVSAFGCTLFDIGLPVMAVSGDIQRNISSRSVRCAEDEVIVAKVQAGLESRSYDHGALVLPPQITSESEHAVAYFQKRYLRAIWETVHLFHPPARVVQRALKKT